MGITWAKKGKRLPVVFSPNEVRKIICQLSGTKWIMVNLLYGAGLRLKECLRLRVKDIDFDYGEITIRSSKGNKDRVTILPEILKEPLRKQIEKVRRLHKKDLKAGFGRVSLPFALERKYANANSELGWQYVSPQPHFISRPSQRFETEIPCAFKRFAKGCQRGEEEGRHYKTCKLSHFSTFVCYALASGRTGYSYCARVVGP